MTVALILETLITLGSKGDEPVPTLHAWHTAMIAEQSESSKPCANRYCLQQHLKRAVVRAHEPGGIRSSRVPCINGGAHLPGLQANAHTDTHTHNTRAASA
jgi:hypothetical protein